MVGEGDAAFDAIEIPRPGPAQVAAWLARPGAAALAGSWLGREGLLALPWPEEARRLRSGEGGCGELVALLDELGGERSRGGRESPFVPGFDGWVIALAYDAGRRFEPWPARLAARPDVDDVVAIRHRASVFLPATGGEAILAAPAGRLNELRRVWAGPPPPAPPSAAGPAAVPLRPIEGLPASIGSDFVRRRFVRAVRSVQDGIARGDYYQVNLTRRFRAPLGELTAAELFLRLRRRHPAPRGAFVSLAPGRAIVSNSPEGFLAGDLASGRVVSSPIKGTAPRDPDLARDAELREGLLRSPKDRAEHVMIVDLVRNDLGRVAATGSVAVERLFGTLATPIVHHLVSDVAAGLAEGVGLGGLVAALFPPGSVTGAPKPAALAAIEELETVRRGYYCGAMGAVDRRGGRFELSVAIRTGAVAGGAIDFHAGGGIVADSDPAAEWEEGNWKAEEMVNAVAAAVEEDVEA